MKITNQSGDLVLYLTYYTWYLIKLNQEITKLYWPSKREIETPDLNCMSNSTISKQLSEDITQAQEKFIWQKLKHWQIGVWQICSLQLHYYL